MAKPQKAKKSNEKGQDGGPVRRRHKKSNTARRREESVALRDDDPAVVINRKRDALKKCEKKLREKLATLPKKSFTVMKWNLDRVQSLEQPRIPRDMPECDARDIISDFNWYKKTWTEFEAAAAALKAKYGRGV